MKRRRKMLKEGTEIAQDNLTEQMLKEYQMQTEKLLEENAELKDTIVFMAIKLAEVEPK